MSLPQNQKLSQSETTTRIFCARAQEKARWQHCTALSFSCLSHRIGLFLKWAISTRVWLLFKELTTVYKIFSCRIILNRFYLSGHHFISMMQCWMKACWALPKLCTTRSVSSHKGTCYWDMYPQHSHVCANVVILCLQHVAATFPASCTLVSAHLKIKQMPG